MNQPILAITNTLSKNNNNKKIREKVETVDRSQFDISEAFVTASHNSSKSLTVP